MGASSVLRSHATTNASVCSKNFEACGRCKAGRRVAQNISDMWKKIASLRAPQAAAPAPARFAYLVYQTNSCLPIDWSRRPWEVRTLEGEPCEIKGNGPWSMLRRAIKSHGEICLRRSSSPPEARLKPDRNGSGFSFCALEPGTGLSVATHGRCGLNRRRRSQILLARLSSARALQPSKLTLEAIFSLC